VTRVLVAVLLVVVAAAAAMAANLALLGYASSSRDPVGKLNPTVRLPAAPAHVLRPVSGPAENEGADD
jgi:hypothetical protein